MPRATAHSVSWHASSASWRFGRNRPHSRSVSGRTSTSRAFSAAPSPADAFRASVSISIRSNSRTVVFVMRSACAHVASPAAFRYATPPNTGDQQIRHRRVDRDPAGMAVGVRMRFNGWIAGLGTASGTRLVVGHWPDSPFGPVTDVMVEHADGRRVLLAETEELGRFVAETYSF